MPLYLAYTHAPSHSCCLAIPLGSRRPHLPPCPSKGLVSLLLHATQFNLVCYICLSLPPLPPPPLLHTLPAPPFPYVRTLPFPLLLHLILFLPLFLTFFFLLFHTLFILFLTFPFPLRHSSSSSSSSLFLLCASYSSSSSFSSSYSSSSPDSIDPIPFRSVTVSSLQIGFLFRLTSNQVDSVTAHLWLLFFYSLSTLYIFCISAYLIGFLQGIFYIYFSFQVIIVSLSAVHFVSFVGYSTFFLCVRVSFTLYQVILVFTDSEGYISFFLAIKFAS